MTGQSLRIKAGPAAGDEIEVEAEFLIGRTAGDAGALGDDPELSREHARITRNEQGQLEIEDLGSRNGTFLNGRRIDGVEPLKPGDVVRVGTSELEVPGDVARVEATRVAEVRQAPGSAPPVLRVISGPAAEQVIEIGPEGLLIGRGADEEGRLGEDPELSRRHASVLPLPDGRLEVKDLGSTNGTFVNGTRIADEHIVQPGDELALGDTKLEVVGEVIPGGQATKVRAQPGAPVKLPAPAAAAPPAPTNSIEVDNLVREFKSGPRAVDGVSIEVKPGEIYGFLGPNGAGKSTTVHMLTTLLSPTEGTARVAGYDIVKEGPQVRGMIGVALQEAALDPVLNAWEHMSLQTALQGVRKKERKKRAEELIERVGLTEAADRKVGGYSGGMKRRLDLALALVHGPEVIFLDEPTTGLDPKSRADLWEEVARLKQEEGVTVFLTTQYLEEADLLADRVGIIAKGKIVAEGTPDALKAEIGRPTVEAVPADPSKRGAVAKAMSPFGESSPAAKGVAIRLRHGVDDLAEIVRALDSEGLQIANLQLHAPTLDDVFLAKTGQSLEESTEETDRAAQATRAQVSLPGQPIIRR